MNSRKNYTVDCESSNTECERDRTTDNHTHEFTGVLRIANAGRDIDDHVHRVAGITSNTIEIDGGKNHVHAYHINTDTFNHFHEIGGRTGPAIYIGDTDKHIHVLCGNSTEVENHTHEYFFTSLIDRPLIEEETRRRYR